MLACRQRDCIEFACVTQWPPTACHAEESALLSQLAGRLHAASILAGGLLLTATQHDTCIAKLGLMQAVAVAAGASR